MKIMDFTQLTPIKLTYNNNPWKPSSQKPSPKIAENTQL
jgi:hypothetical protein